MTLHIGKRYNIKLLATISLKYDRWGSSKTRQNVVILDKQTNKLYQYMGYGMDLGNFHPIYIHPKRDKIQVEVLLREEKDIFPVRGHRLVTKIEEMMEKS